MPCVNKLRKHLPSLDIDQDNALEIFFVKWNIISELNEELPNDIFAKFDGSSPITDKYYWQYITDIYYWQILLIDITDIYYWQILLTDITDNVTDR